MAFNFKTATPVTSGLTDSFLYFGAESQAEADPDIYTLLALKNYVLAGVSSDITTRPRPHLWRPRPTATPRTTRRRNRKP